MVGKVCGVRGCLSTGNRVSSGSSRVAERRRAPKVVWNQIAKNRRVGVWGRASPFQASGYEKSFYKGRIWGAVRRTQKWYLQLMGKVG
jgi:hypothetical protein